VGEEEAKFVGEQQYKLANMRSNREEMTRLQAEHFCPAYPKAE
jgi:hypothetical protein